MNTKNPQTQPKKTKSNLHWWIFSNQKQIFPTFLSCKKKKETEFEAQSFPRKPSSEFPLTHTIHTQLKSSSRTTNYSTTFFVTTLMWQTVNG